MTKERLEFMSLVQCGILKLDTKCHICGSTENLQLHHIIPLANGGTNIQNNLLTLCGECHGKVHDNAGLKLAREKIAKKKKGEFILIDNTTNTEYTCKGWEEVSNIILELCNKNPEVYQYSRIKATTVNTKLIRSKMTKLKSLYPERLQSLENGNVLIKDFIYKGNVDLIIITTRRKDGIN